MRAITSATVEYVKRSVFSRIGEPRLRQLAINCLSSTLDTTIKWEDGQDPFVITGDIPAMWLRDSSSQLEPYVRFVGEDGALKSLIGGVIARQAFYIREDPYANAFNATSSGREGFPRDITKKNPWVFERKFELDSLCHPIRLWWSYFRAANDRSMFTPGLREALNTIIRVMEVELDHSRSEYTFQRPSAPETDTLKNAGRGTQTNPSGLIWSGFRPSDDACEHHYLIPSEMFAVVSLHQLRELIDVGFADSGAIASADRLIANLRSGIREYATHHHPVYGDIWAYEVDGFGRQKLMDDANIPSLLSLPYLGYCDLADRQYQRTRAFILSPDNPYYFEGKLGAGVGSPHTPERWFWPLAITMQALTATTDEERDRCVQMLLRSDADTGYMHESVNVNNADHYTRPWFAWANSLFAELMLRTLGLPGVRVPAQYGGSRP